MTAAAGRRGGRFQSRYSFFDGGKRNARLLKFHRLSSLLPHSNGNEATVESSFPKQRSPVLLMPFFRLDFYLFGLAALFPGRRRRKRMGGLAESKQESRRLRLSCREEKEEKQRTGSARKREEEEEGSLIRLVAPLCLSSPFLPPSDDSGVA